MRGAIWSLLAAVAASLVGIGVASGTLGHFFGLDNLSGPNYGFWSGAGSDIGEITIIAGAIAIYRRHNCHVQGCWRLQWKRVPGTEHFVCRRHHPMDAPTAQQVIDDHHAACG